MLVWEQVLSRQHLERVLKKAGRVTPTELTE